MRVRRYDIVILTKVKMRQGLRRKISWGLFHALNEVSDAENTKASVRISGMPGAGGTGAAIL